MKDTLIWTTKNGHCHDLKTLLGVGVNVNIRDIFGFSPLSWAAITGSDECVRLLLKAGAVVNTVINHDDIYLIATASSKMNKCVLALIDAGTGVSRPGNCSNACKCTAVNSNQETLDTTIRAGTEVSIICCVGLSFVIGGYWRFQHMHQAATQCRS